MLETRGNRSRNPRALLRMRQAPQEFVRGYATDASVATVAVGAATGDKAATAAKIPHRPRVGSAG